ncbi:hypothetical protein [Erwinia sp. TECH1]
MMPVSVTYSQSFINLMQSLSTEELRLIGDFVTLVKTSGYSCLPGRNKPSTGVSERHYDRLRLIQYAIDKNLWHYHVGFIKYDQNKLFGDWTSSHVVHYQNTNNTARFVHYDSHPPMRLPRESTLI